MIKLITATVAACAALAPVLALDVAAEDFSAHGRRLSRFSYRKYICGLPGHKCCSWKRCVHGYVCKDWKCVKKEVAPPPCGAAGEACCTDGSKCDAHSLACVHDVCTPCGDGGQPVCNEEGVAPCNDGYEPKDGKCVEETTPPPPCGDLDWACCTEGPACKVDDLVCSGNVGDEGSKCVLPAACGGEDEPCCEDGSACDAHSLACVNDFCVPCGKKGKPVCTEEGVAPCEDGLEAKNGECKPIETACGAAGEACCTEGSKCDKHSLACVGNVCTACGDGGQPVCDEDGVDACNDGYEPKDGTCVEEMTPPPPCGDRDWACCTEGPACKVDDLECSGPIGDEGSVCVLPAACGGKDEPCCEDSSACDAHSLACVNDICVSCGKEDKPVCTEDGAVPCEEGLVVKDGKCVKDMMEGEEGDEGDDGKDGDEGDEGEEGDEGKEGDEGDEGKEGKFGDKYDDGCDEGLVCADHSICVKPKKW